MSTRSSPRGAPSRRLAVVWVLPVISTGWILVVISISFRLGRSTGVWRRDEVSDRSRHRPRRWAGHLYFQSANNPVMDQIAAMRVFARVVESGTFTRAADL